MIIQGEKKVINYKSMFCSPRKSEEKKRQKVQSDSLARQFTADECKRRRRDKEKESSWVRPSSFCMDLWKESQHTNNRVEWGRSGPPPILVMHSRLGA